MSAALNEIRDDPAFSLEMPGCFLTGVNAAAAQYFQSRSEFDLIRLVEAETKECICKTLVGPHAYLSQYCPIEVANSELDESGFAAPQLWALRYHADPKPRREYELFRVHVMMAGSHGIITRLIPFPSVMRLIVSDLPGSGESAQIRRITSVPAGIRVEASSLMEEDSFPLDRLKDTGVLAELEDAARFYADVLHCLGKGHTPSYAWRWGCDNNPDIRRDIPPSIVHAFRDGATNAEATQEIHTLWQHALDAPVLMTNIFPELQSRLDADRTLQLAENLTVGDRDQYSRLHLSIENLRRQDEMNSWLPMSAFYREMRETVRAELSEKPFTEQ